MIHELMMQNIQEENVNNGTLPSENTQENLTVESANSAQKTKKSIKFYKFKENDPVRKFEQKASKYYTPKIKKKVIV